MKKILLTVLVCLIAPQIGLTVNYPFDAAGGNPCDTSYWDAINVELEYANNYPSSLTSGPGLNVHRKNTQSPIFKVLSFV